MKILARLFSIILLMILFTHHEIHCAESKTLANDLAQLSNQLDQLAQASTPFPSQITLPNTIKILDNNVSNEAPTLENLKAFAQATDIELVQLVVVYQDLSLATFCKKEDQVEKQLAQLLALESGSSNQKIMEYLLLNTANQTLQTALKDAKIDANLNYSVGGGSASCGYHTLCHLQTLHDFFNKKANESANLNNLTSLKFINELFGETIINDTFNIVLTTKIQSPGEWRDMIIEEQKKRLKNKMSSVSTDDGEWLRDSGMTHLENNIKILKNTEFSLWYFDIHKSPYEMGFVQERTNKKEFKIPITMNIGNSHWYGTYLLKNQNSSRTLCVIVDSKNAPRYGTKLIINMLTALFPDQADKIANNQNLLRAQDPIKITKEIERLQLLRIFAATEDARTLKENLPANLSPAELLFIFNDFAYFELVRDILKNYKTFIGAYEQLHRGTIKNITSLSQWLEKNHKLDDELANTVAQVMVPVFEK